MFYITIVLIFCFLMITEGFLWHKRLWKKECLEKREENDKEKRKAMEKQIHMEEDLYWCKQWKHQWHGRFETCVSDLIEEGGLLQIHCIAIEHMRTDSWLVRGCDTTDFQKKIREVIHAFQVKMGFPRDWYDMDNSELQAHIWYYNPDGSDWSSADDIPMRVAITLHRPDKVEEEAFKLLQQQIYEILWEVLDNRE